MKIYLVRHAEAVERAEGLEDTVRWLTPKGRKTMQKAALRLHRRMVRPELIITSPLTRAVQTAELLMSTIGKRSVLTADHRLVPEASPEQVMELIQSHARKDRIMLVGHEPLLSQTAGLLLGEIPLPGFGKASCFCLELLDSSPKPARFGWYAPRTGSIVTSLKKILKESSA